MSHEEAEAVSVTATSRSHVEDVVCRLVGEMSPVTTSPAASDQLLIADLGYYSLLVIELAFALEELFDLRLLAAEDPPPVGTVRELQDYVIEKVRSGAATVPDMAEVDAFLRTR
jgi:acyl carrier protein